MSGGWSPSGTRVAACASCCGQRATMSPTWRRRRGITGQVGATGWASPSRNYGKIDRKNMSTIDLPTNDETRSSRPVIASHLGGTTLRAATVDSEGRIHERVKHTTPKAVCADEIVQ